MGLVGTFSPQGSVAAVPGSIYNLLQWVLWAICHAKVCARPPEPIKSMFMVQAKINQIILTFTGLKGRFPVDEAGCPVILAINPEWRKCCNITRMLTIFTQLFGKKSDKDVKELLPLVQKINEEYGKLSPLSNDEQRDMTRPFKHRIAESLEKVDAEIADLNKKGEAEELHVNGKVTL